jgi:ribosomal-protein-alanine N-acetyltransferase
VPVDAAWLARLHAENRDFLAPFEPERPDGFCTEAGQLAHVEGAVRARADDVAYAFAIVAEGEPAGTITLSNVARGPFQNANVGYWVDGSRNGKGIATRAVALAVEHAFGELGLHRVQAGTLVDNRASQRVLEKNGFHRIGVSPRYLLIAGAWRDHVLFAKTAG